MQQNEITQELSDEKIDINVAIDNSKISSLLNAVNSAKFKDSEISLNKEEKFIPRTLVEIAFASKNKNEDLNSEDKKVEIPEETEVENKTQEKEVSVEIQDQNTLEKSDDNTENSSSTLNIKEIEDTAFKDGYERGYEAAKNENLNPVISEEQNELKEKEQQEKFEILKKFKNHIENAITINSINDKLLYNSIENAIINLAIERSGSKIRENPLSFAKKIKRLVNLIKGNTDFPKIYLNKDDFEIMKSWIDNSDTFKNWQIFPKSDLSSGDILVDLDGVEIEDILDVAKYNNKMIRAKTNINLEQSAEGLETAEVTEAKASAETETSEKVSETKETTEENINLEQSAEGLETAEVTEATASAETETSEKVSETKETIEEDLKPNINDEK